MNGWGAFLLGGGLVALTLYIHKRRLTWVALALALISGVLISVSFLGGWLRDLGVLIPYAPLLLVLVGVTVIGLDLRDKNPDKPAIILMMIVPTFFALGLGQLPELLALIGASFGHVGSDASQQMGR